MNRREWLRQAMVAGALVGVGRRGWALPLDGRGTSRLVVLMLRGAVDGLSVVVPHADPAYARQRPRIALGAPGRDGGALDLDGRFGLHPALAPLLPRWRDGSLAFVHACGSPDPTRSHFEAQAYMETATPGVATTPDGWLNRLLGVLPGTVSPTTAVSLGNTQPKIVAGRHGVASIALGRDAGRARALDRPVVGAAFDALYRDDAQLGEVYREGRAARTQLREDLAGDAPGGVGREDPKASAGAPSAQGFDADARQLARLMTRDPRLRLAFLALGGWDTHVNQGNADGQLARRLAPLGSGLATLAAGLGDAYRDTAIVVMSEFGRTVRENGNGGTDHGHGNAMWLLGGAIAGGKVYGEWPGLDDGALYEGRDLAVTTDFRAPLAALCAQHLGLDSNALDAVFPHAPPLPRSLARLVRRA